MPVFEYLLTDVDAKVSTVAAVAADVRPRPTNTAINIKLNFFIIPPTPSVVRAYLRQIAYGLH